MDTNIAAVDGTLEAGKRYIILPVSRGSTRYDLIRVEKVNKVMSIVSTYRQHCGGWATPGRMEIGLTYLIEVPDSISDEAASKGAEMLSRWHYHSFQGLRDAGRMAVAKACVSGTFASPSTEIWLNPNRWHFWEAFDLSPEGQD